MKYVYTADSGLCSVITGPSVHRPAPVDISRLNTGLMRHSRHTLYINIIIFKTNTIQNVSINQVLILK